MLRKGCILKSNLNTEYYKDVNSSYITDIHKESINKY